MISDKVYKLLNEQVIAELYSAYLYLDFSNYYMEAGLEGYGNWYMIQAQEERDHAMLFIQYLQQQGLHITLDAIDKPDKKYESHLDPLKMGAEHERLVTSLIHNIYKEAQSDNDFRTMQFLDWFVKEQAEEEANADANVTAFELFGEDKKALYELDNEMKTRVYTAPSLVL